MKVPVFGIVTFLFCIAPLQGSALVITEIMYDPFGSDTGSEWIEVFNNGTSSIELARMRLHDKNNHVITLVHGSAAIAPGAYAIIVRDSLAFETVYPNASLTLFRSSFSLNNTGGTISIQNAATHALDIATCTRSLGSDGDGNTLNRDVSRVAFVARSPSPGTVMSQSAIAPKPTPVATTKQTSKKQLKTPPKSRTSFDKKTKNTYAHTSAKDDVDAISTETISDVLVVSDTVQTAAAVSSAPNSTWLLALFGLVALSITAIFSARHFAKREWDIIEESGE